MQFITHSCRIAVFVALASLPLSARQSGGRATMTGHVSAVVAVSAGSPARVAGGDAQVSARAAGAQALIFSLSGSRAGETQIEIPVRLRSNVESALLASWTAQGATLSGLYVVEVRGAGALTYPGAAGRVQVPPMFDGRTGTPAPRDGHPTLSSPATILSAPPISMGGGLDSPGNMIEVVLRVVLTAPDSGDGWHAELKLSAARRAGAEQPAPSAESPLPREKDVRRAEKVLEKLRLLDEAAASHEGEERFRSLARKLYPGLLIAVSDMRPSDLKTDLGTAAFLYEDAARAWSLAGRTTADCEGERPDLYRPLCLGLGGGTVRQLLFTKARLHSRWAEAVVKTCRGEGGAGTSRLLSEMKAAREQDLRIAARISGTLKSLEGMVNTPAGYAAYVEQRAEVRVGSERLEAEFSDALGRAGALLGWMPRSPVYYSLSSAWRSYGDGLFWYRKASGSRKLVVSAASGFERDPLEELRLGAGQVGYTVVVNWRAAAKYTRLAEQSLPSAAGR